MAVGIVVVFVFVIRVGRKDGELDGDFLIASDKGVADKIDVVVVLALGGGVERELDLGMTLQGDALDGQQEIALEVTDKQPPSLDNRLGVERSMDELNVLIILTIKIDNDSDSR